MGKERREERITRDVTPGGEHPMAAPEPQQDEPDDRSGRPVLASAPAAPTRRSRWIWIVIGIVVLAVIGVVAYMALYNGGGGGGGYGGGNGGGGTGGGAYFILGFSTDQARRLRNWIRSRR
jgi:hypothetical protein